MTQKIENINTATLIPYAGNSRTHDENQVSQIAASIKEFGFTNPILIDADNGIIAGHGRLLAAQKLGIEKVPCIKLSHLSDAQRRAYVIADNKLALNAGWDMDALCAELERLAEESFDLNLIGFDESELSEILKSEDFEGLTDEDDIPEVPENPVTVEGDVWLLGDHRLMCGDSTNSSCVDLLLKGVKPHLMVTDPPYGVNYDANWRNETSRLGLSGRAVGKVENDDNADWTEAWRLFPGDIAYVWHAGTKAHIVAESLISAGFEIRSQIIWGKSNMVISQCHYHPKHEPCWYAVRKGKQGHWSGDRKQTTLWEIQKPLKSETGHSTQKPVECMSRPIENNSSPGQVIYEPFSGSGTTIIAGEKLGRYIYAMELSPSHVDVGVKRWQDFTGKKAVHEKTGKTFGE